MKLKPVVSKEINALIGIFIVVLFAALSMLVIQAKLSKIGKNTEQPIPVFDSVIAVIDDESKQIKIFNAANGSLVWTIGLEGGYMDTVDVIAPHCVWIRKIKINCK